MTSRRSFITAVLAFLGWRPETPEQKIERLRAKIREAVKTTEFTPPLPPKESSFLPNRFVILDGNRVRVWPTLGGPDEP